MAKEESFEKNGEKKDWEDEWCKKEWRGKKWHRHGGGGMMGGCFYFFAFIGVMAYNLQQVSGFWPDVLAVLKAIVWPAFLLYKVFSMLHM